MSAAAPATTMRHLTVSLCAVIVSLLWGGSAAQAGCGDYVLVDGVALHDVAHRDHFVVPLKKPCQGPQCSRAPAGPVTTVAFVVHLRVDASEPSQQASVSEHALTTWPVPVNEGHEILRHDTFLRPPCLDA